MSGGQRTSDATLTKIAGSGKREKQINCKSEAVVDCKMKGAAAGKGDLRKMMRSALAQKKQEKKITSPLVRYRAPIPTLFNLYFYILFCFLSKRLD
jgi:hypothetical protein